MTRMRTAVSRTLRAISMTGPGSGLFPHGEHLHRTLGAGAAGAHESVPAVERRFLDYLTGAPAGDDVAAGRLPKGHRDDRLPLHIHHPADRGRREAFHAHLAEVCGRPPTVGATVVNRPIDQLEDLAAEGLHIALFGCELAGERWTRARVSGSITADEDDEMECHRHPAGNPTGHSMANSRLNTTSKLKVLPLLRVSMCSAIRLSRAGMPIIFSWAFRPSSFSPSRLSIFQYRICSC